MEGVPGSSELNELNMNFALGKWMGKAIHGLKSGIYVVMGTSGF